MLEVTPLNLKKRSEDAACPEYEASLIERLKRQDTSAFQELINLHGDSIRNLVGRLMAFDPEMEDVIQNTLIQVWRNIGSFRNESSLKTWITRIAIMQTRNQQRSVRRWMRRLQDRWSMENASSLSKNRTEHIEDPRWDSIQSAMKTLDYRDREILVLVYLQGNTVKWPHDAPIDFGRLHRHSYSNHVHSLAYEFSTSNDIAN